MPHIPTSDQHKAMRETMLALSPSTDPTIEDQAVIDEIEALSSPLRTVMHHASASALASGDTRIHEAFYEVLTKWSPKLAERQVTLYDAGACYALES